ncbi:ATP-binding protein [Rhizobium sp. FKL33]|uniref:ATP-binding protein n=1 Tax=Rhizobium sp. FKL33 TaxID=2562307 RepID=UPI0010C1089B|nr:ATP-binding protein [Rhizobium sp. FKL33]
MRWFTASLTRQLISLLLMALILGQVIPFALSWQERKVAIRETSLTEFIGRAAALSRLVDKAPELRDNILAASATNSTRFWSSDHSPMDAAAWMKEAQKRYDMGLGASDANGDRENDKRLLLHIAENLDASDLRWTVLTSEAWGKQPAASYIEFAQKDGMAIVTQLADGRWLNAFYFKPLKGGFWRRDSILPMVATALALCIIGVILAREIARPLNELATSAEAIGRGEAVQLSEGAGPTEIRRLKQAFNSMQLRLTRYIEDRTRMLAAIGHDLRTPLTTLRLRAEFLPDDEAREKILVTISEMEAMTAATLDFAKSDASGEATRLMDLGALVGSLCEDLAELGHDVTFEDDGKLTCRCRPDGLKRAVRNLIENAVRYAGHARVRLQASETLIDISVDDDGPGIPREQIEQVFLPFYRLESSRNAGTGGVGLGLSIARTIARQHGGDVLIEVKERGLTARVTIPRA